MGLIPDPVWINSFALPSVNLQPGVKRASADRAIPLGTIEVRCEVDPTLWPAGTQVTASLVVSDDNGATWRQDSSVASTTEQQGVRPMYIGIRFDSGVGNTNPQFKARAEIVASKALTLAGFVRVR